MNCTYRRQLQLVLFLLFWVGMVWFAVVAEGRKPNNGSKKPAARFNVPKAPRPPDMRGQIRERDWSGAVKIRGLACADVPAYADGQLRRWIITEPPRDFDERRVIFWMMWDGGNLYFAARSAIAEKQTLTREQRAVRPIPPVIHDDAFEFAVDASGLDSTGGTADRVFMCILNPFGLEQCRRLPRDYEPYGRMPSVSAQLKGSSRVWTDKSGQRWWDVQVAFDLDDLNLGRELKSGDRLRVSMARIFQFPWRYSSLPTSSSYMVSDGFPVARLVEEQPYVKIDELEGLSEGQLRLRGRTVNPASRQKSIRLTGRIHKDGETETSGWTEESGMEIPAGGSGAFDMAGEIDAQSGRLQMMIATVEESGAVPIYECSIGFESADGHRFLDFQPIRPAFPLDYVRFDRELERLQIQTDAVVADHDDPASIEALTCRVWSRDADEREVIERRSGNHKAGAFTVELDLSDVPPGDYGITGVLLNGDGEALAERRLKGFEKISDERGERYV